MYDLHGKTAVITGCMQGIGKTTMETFIESGADVFACCQKETTGLNEYIESVGKDRITPLYFDLLDESTVKKAAMTIQKTRRPVDILVNIAGVTDDVLFPMLTMEKLKRNFAINFFSPILFTQYISHLMLRRGKGSIINVSSISALDGNAGQVAYASSKAALIGATLTLSREFGPKGIRVNAVTPGVIDTDMTRELPENELERQMGRSKLKRKGTAKEVADTIAFLASDFSSYITGQVIRIDGGIG
jgi:3-oxoacyl-[acyl-carrier protein] reductase